MYIDASSVQQNPLVRPRPIFLFPHKIFATCPTRNVAGTAQIKIFHGDVLNIISEYTYINVAINHTIDTASRAIVNLFPSSFLFGLFLLSLLGFSVIKYSLF